MTATTPSLRILTAFAPVLLCGLASAQTGTRNWDQHPLTGNWIGRTDGAPDWQTSEDLAVSLGGNLLTIRNEPENNWIQQYTQNVPHWMGMNDVAVEGTWEWSSGEPVTWTNWYGPQPDGDDGGVINPDFANSPGTWFASAGGRYGILELPQIPWTDWLPPYHLLDWGYHGACGDLDGDGAPDIVIPNPQTANHEIWLNDGKGWFAKVQSLGGPAWPREVQLVDIDLDGDNDLVSSDQLSNRGVGWALNDGTGTLGGITWFNPSNSNWYGLRCADFNGDGYPDVVVTDYDSGAHVLLNDQSGGFSSGWSTSTGVRSHFVEVADLDLDGNLDFVTSNDGSDSLTICMGAGDGTFTASSLATAAGPMQIAIEDMNADGVPEILVPTNDWRIRVYERDSMGNYNQKIQIVTTARPSHPLVADFNLDGILDVACAKWGGPDFEMFYGTGVWQFDPPIQKLTGHLHKIVAADVTLDGAPDIVTFGAAGTTVHHNLHQNASPWTLSPVNGNWYRATDPLSWQDAEAQAVAWGGHLTTIRNQTENDWLAQKFYGDGSFFWIGFTDQASEGNFVWAGGETPGFTNWRLGEPNDTNGADWAVLIPAVGNWMDEPNLPVRVGVVEVISGDCDGNGLPDVYEAALDPTIDWNGDGVLDSCSSPNYCTAIPNSSGLPAVISVSGSPVISDNDLTLIASQMAINNFGYFVMGPNQGLITNPGGSAGNLCLGAPFYRFNKNGGVLYSGAGGTFSLLTDLTNLPNGLVFQIGETWNFISWFRDGKTSNFTDGTEVMFR